eukprot:c13293_g1_i1.p1 GENE.c13293_g1_i1~~c13293_g1_i1.p1  ORF type:complete len:129 (+),score=30.11 c13293_g1_i1:55-441(+)
MELQQSKQEKSPEVPYLPFTIRSTLKRRKSDLSLLLMELPKSKKNCTQEDNQNEFQDENSITPICTTIYSPQNNLQREHILLQTPIAMKIQTNPPGAPRKKISSSSKSLFISPEDDHIRRVLNFDIFN